MGCKQNIRDRIDGNVSFLWIYIFQYNVLYVAFVIAGAQRESTIYRDYPPQVAIG